MIFVCRGQPPFRVLLACGRSCCYGLSHFLQLTFPCWHSRVCFSFHKFHFMLHTAIANRTQELAFIRSFRFIPLISLSGYMSFPTLQIHVFAAVFRFTPHRFTTTHTYTLSVHSLQYTPFGHSYQPLLFPTLNVQAKKCAKPAAGSTRPQRPALSVSGALAQLA